MNVSGYVDHEVFSTDRELSPAAWCDFNADEFLDLVVIRGDKKTVEILVGGSGDPSPFTSCRQMRTSNITTSKTATKLMRHCWPDKKTTSNNDSKIYFFIIRCTCRGIITSVAPGDFDGDAILDLMVTAREASASEYTAIYILWGNLTNIDCTPMNSDPLLQLRCQPLVFDADGDMVADLFGLDENEDRMIWRMSGRCGATKVAVQLDPPSRFTRMHIPHSNAFIDLDGDGNTDLIVTTTESYEVWLNRGEEGFLMNGTNDIALPPPPVRILGQSLFLDINLDGKIEHIVPVCYDRSCRQSSILIYSCGGWYNANVSLIDEHGISWGFLPPVSDESQYFSAALTLRSGDLNMDGYPDFMATLRTGTGAIAAFLFLNVPAPESETKRSFRVLWDVFENLNDNTVAGMMADLSNNGALDVIFVKNTTPPTVVTVRDVIQYDGNFLKTMVISSRTNSLFPESPPMLGHGRRLVSPPFPGPAVRYSANRLDGNCQVSYGGQLSQSAYFALHLPYVLFGLGRRPNFVDSLEVSYGGQRHRWTEIVPNSQVVVTAASVFPCNWQIRLYLRPNKLILRTLGITSGLFIVIAIVLIVLNFIEKATQESEFFHFHAM